MFVSWRWISEMVDTTGVDPVAFSDRFVLAVAEIEGIVQIGPGLEGVRVGEVVGVAPHPNADKLRLADVDLGAHGRVRVVCGAPDLRVGMRVPFVPPGCKLPSGIEVRDGDVRGERSPGMLASEADLGLSEDHDGLLELHGCDAANGTELLDALPIRDTLYEIDNKSLTHRPDLWGHIGIAREIAALLDRPLCTPSAEVAWTTAPPLAAGVTIAADAAEVCPRYLAARFSGVRVGPSPVATRLRLRALGVRPISNVVDATNLVMLETGNPLHAFDARFVRGETITVRLATPGETIRTLDDVVRTLEPTDLVIADGAGPVALAGIMGGGDSEIREETESVVLEAANFDGARIRKTSARLGLRSESSARFEKSLDPDLPAFAAARFARVLAELSPGAVPASALLDVGSHPAAPAPLPVITTSRGYLRQRLGLSAELLPDAALDRTLQRLGFTVDAQGDVLVVTVPRFRAGRDVGIADDLVEELGRHYGYDRIPSATVLAEAKPAPLPADKQLERRLREICALGAGLTEVQLYSFEHEPTRERLGLQSHDAAGRELPRLRLRNTLSSEHVALRRGLAEGLLGAIERNLGHGTAAAPPQKGLRVGLFELGRGYLPEQQPAEGADYGLPAVLLGDAGDDARDGYLARLGPALAADAEAAVQGRKPLPHEPRRLAIAIGERTGGAADGGVAEALPAELTASLWQEATAALAAICDGLGLPAPLLRRADRDAVLLATAEAGPGLPDAAPGWLHPGRHAWIVLPAGAHGPARRLGLCSMLHPRARAAMEVPAEVVLVEIDRDALLAASEGIVRRAGRPPRLPATSFDLSIPVRADVGADVLRGRVHSALAGAATLGAMLEDVAVVTTFRADQGAHPYTVTLRVRLRSEERTVRDVEAQQARAAIAHALVDWQDGCEPAPVTPALAERLGLGASA
ncbi:MAG: hypothetical protein RIT45_790 [Pseudomonadota bacterium]